MIARLEELRAELAAWLRDRIRGRRIRGLYVRKGYGVPPGWRLEKLEDRDAYLALPWPVWWIRRAWSRRWAPVELALRIGILEGEDGGYYRDARPRGWAAVTCWIYGHVREAPRYRSPSPASHELDLASWALVADDEPLGFVVLTSTVHRCRRCRDVLELPADPVIVVVTSRREFHVDDDALDAFLPELHTPPMPRP